MQQDLFDQPAQTASEEVTGAGAAQRSGMSAEPEPTYEHILFSGVPLYTTRLVREGEFSFPQRTQVTTPEEVARVLRDYFKDRDREEFVVCLLDTVTWD